MSTNALHKLIWALIFGGMVALAIGFSVARGDASVGWTLMTGGGIAVALGALLIVVRSRMQDR